MTAVAPKTLYEDWQTRHERLLTEPAGNLLFTSKNLIRDGGTDPKDDMSGSKRLWDAPDLDGVNQYTKSRDITHYTVGY